MESILPVRDTGNIVKPVTADQACSSSRYSLLTHSRSGAPDITQKRQQISHITVDGKQPVRPGRRVNTAPFMVGIKTLVAARDSSRSRVCLTGIYSGDKWAGSRGRLLGGITQTWESKPGPKASTTPPCSAPSCVKTRSSETLEFEAP